MLRNTNREMTAARSLAIRELRDAFEAHGFNVDHYTDDQISEAVRAGDVQSFSTARQQLAFAFGQLPAQ